MGRTRRAWLLDAVQQAASMVPDWRDAAAYAELHLADRATLAWEWLRRSPAYRTAADQARSAEHSGVWPGSPRRWGLVGFEDFRLGAPLARPLWSAADHSPVLRAVAAAAEDGVPAFEFAALGGLLTALPAAGQGEHLLLSDGWRTLRIDLEEGSSAGGPVRLRFYLDAPADFAGTLLALRRFAALWRAGRFCGPLNAPEPRARRWVALLRTSDALAAGADQRTIAAALLSPVARDASWRAIAPSLRLQAQRLVRDARAMADGGHRALLGRAQPDPNFRLESDRAQFRASASRGLGATSSARSPIPARRGRHG